jgi:hypothetical protein
LFLFRSSDPNYVPDGQLEKQFRAQTMGQEVGGVDVEKAAEKLKRAVQTERMRRLAETSVKVWKVYAAKKAAKTAEEEQQQEHNLYNFQRCMVVLIAALILVTTHGSYSAHGVDDWKAADLAKFFAESGSPSVSEAKIVALGLSSSDLFDGSVQNSLLTELGATSKIQQNAVQAAITALDAKVTHSPVDFFEWRIANLREFELWLSPLAMGAPRICALYGRYSTQPKPSNIAMVEDSGKMEPAFELVDDVYDATPPLDFWLTFFFCPYLPLFKIASGFSVPGTFLDTMLYYIVLVRAVRGPLDSMATVQNNSICTFFQKQFQHEFSAWIWAVFGYLVLWHIIPRFILVRAIYWHVYISLPLIALADVRHILEVARSFEKAHRPKVGVPEDTYEDHVGYLSPQEAAMLKVSRLEQATSVEMNCNN